MKVRVSSRAAQDLERQLDHLVGLGQIQPARALKTRVFTFLRRTLARHPRIGVSIDYRELRECWIPGTRLVVWYRIVPDAIEVARLWHVSQDRTARDG